MNDKKSAFYFKFYPGDYLRDTQCLSEKAQVAYDRIMCEHMRNICISYEQHKFFTKRLNADEREELLSVLHDCGTGYQIEWVVKSIDQSRAYSESRSKNRKSENKKTYDEDMKTYDHHMESNSNSNSNSKKDKEGLREKKEKQEIEFPDDSFRTVWNDWTSHRKSEYRDSFKTVKAEQTAFDKLFRLSEGDSKTAYSIVIQSIENHWKGLFPLKQNGSKSNTTGSLWQHNDGQPPKLGTSAARIEALKRW